jgi:predicted metalloprotease with PDZ domain
MENVNVTFQTSSSALKIINLKKMQAQKTQRSLWSITKCTISMTLKYRLQIKKSIRLSRVNKDKIYLVKVPISIKPSEEKGVE